MRYVVPYSAPGIKWGQLRIEAESSWQAQDKAREIHASTVTLYRKGGKSARMTLRKRERAQIVYGEPLALVDAVAS